MTSDEQSAEQPQQPLLKVINQNATAEEVAALVAVFSALGSSGGEAPTKPRPSWNLPARGVRTTHRHGPGAWRTSGLPR